MSKVQTAPLGAEAQRQIELTRVRNGVAAVAQEDEGAPLGQLPDGVFGFTYSPIDESTPLYATRTVQSFEVHKLTNGVVHLLGFLKPAEASKLTGTPEEFDLNLYPEPNGESTELVEVPLERIVRAKPLSRTDGNFMPLKIEGS
jgi:hypothetical protein